MHPFFSSLGRTVLDRWKRANFSLAAFPDIATTALNAKPPSRHVDLAPLMRDFLLDDEQPLQTDSDFGEPELVAYAHPRFYVQLLFWMDGTTAIHQHEFSGAFHVMHGSSIHAHYDFKNEKPITPYLRVGDLRMKNIELLDTGRTVPIVSGPHTIHSLFHLDSPSVTVVVRTQHDPGTGPQLNYLPPHVAVDPHFSDKLTLRRKQLLGVLEQVGDPGYGDLVLRMIRDLDFERGFSVLHHAMPYLQHLGQWQPIIKAFEKKHGAPAKGVAKTLAEDLRRGFIKGLRSSVLDPDHRFFLALLMNVPTRADLLALVANRFPKQRAVDVVLQWCEQLLEVTHEGVTLLDAMFPDTPPDLVLAALRHFLARGKKPPAGLSAADLKKLHDTFAHSALAPLLR